MFLACPLVIYHTIHNGLRALKKEGASIMTTFKIASQFDGKVLDVPGFATGNGAVIQQFQDNGGVNQQWQLILANDDGITYKIVSQGTGKVLDVPGFATDN